MFDDEILKLVVGEVLGFQGTRCGQRHQVMAEVRLGGINRL